MTTFFISGDQHFQKKQVICCADLVCDIQDVPKKSIHSLNHYNLIKLLILLLNKIDTRE